MASSKSKIIWRRKHQFLKPLINYYCNHNHYLDLARTKLGTCSIHFMSMMLCKCNRLYFKQRTWIKHRLGCVILRITLRVNLVGLQTGRPYGRRPCLALPRRLANCFCTYTLIISDSSHPINRKINSYFFNYTSLSYIFMFMLIY